MSPISNAIASSVHVASPHTAAASASEAETDRDDTTKVAPAEDSAGTSGASSRDAGSAAGGTSVGSNSAAAAAGTAPEAADAASETSSAQNDAPGSAAAAPEKNPATAMVEREGSAGLEALAAPTEPPVDDALKAERFQERLSEARAATEDVTAPPTPEAFVAE